MIHWENAGPQLHKDAESLGNYPEEYSQKKKKIKILMATASVLKISRKKIPCVGKATLEFSRKEKGLPGGKGKV